MKMKKTFPILVIALLAGCGWKADGLERLESRYGTDATESEPTCPAASDATPEASAAPAMSGTWAVRLVQHSLLLGSMPLHISDLFVGKVAADGTGIDLTFCTEDSVGSDFSSKFGQTTMSDEAVHGLNKSSPVRIPLAAGALPKATRVAWQWGVNLAKPFDDALPTDKTDPRIFDQDGDGRPGLTVTVAEPAGDRYMAKRVVWDLADGAGVGGDWVFGGLAFRIDQQVYGATSSILETVAPIESDPAAPSAWQMHKEADDLDCPKLLAKWKELFGCAPTP